MKYYLLLLLWVLPDMVYAQVDTVALYARAKTLMQDKKYETAISVLTQLLAIDIDNDEWLYDRGTCYAALGKGQEAVDDYTAAIASNPSCAYCYLDRASILNMAHQTNQALSDANAALLLMPAEDTARKQALAIRGWIKYSYQDHKNAIEDFKAALAIDSGYLPVLVDICGAYLALNMKPELDHYVAKVLKQDSTSAMWLSNLAFICIQNEQYDEALSFANRAVTTDGKSKEPNTGVPYNNRGYIRYKKGDMKGALKDINKAIEIWPANSYAYRNRALVYVATKEIKKACEDIKLALDYGYTEQYGEDMQQLLEKHCGGK